MSMQIAFWVLSAITIIAALGVVLQLNLFRAAVLLIVCFLGTAGIFVILSADFIAAAQVIINVGAVAILIILSIMLTREVTRGSPSNRMGLPAFMVIGVFTAMVIFAIVNTTWPVSELSPVEETTPILANLMLDGDGFILVIQLSGLMLLSIIIGAIVLLKEQK